MVRTFFVMIVSSLVLYACGSPAGDNDTPNDSKFPAQEGSGEKDGYRLIWQDLFDGEVLDPECITALPNQGDQAKMYVDFVRVYQK